MKIYKLNYFAAFLMFTAFLANLSRGDWWGAFPFLVGTMLEIGWSITQRKLYNLENK